MIDLNKLDTFKKIGCVGSRNINQYQKDLCFFIGFSLAFLGKKILSGNADGADLSFAKGANSVDPTLVTLYLPNKSYNSVQIDKNNHVIYEHDSSWIELAKKNHVAYNYLKPYVKLLMNRNAGIVLPNVTKLNTGGTQHDIRIAESLNIPYLNIAEKKVENALIIYLKSQLSGNGLNNERTRKNT
jgi:hypothetical protein